MDGFLIIDKPENITCQGVCNKLKRIYNIKKIGHNGTLDPMTTGVMVVGINKGTKFLNYLLSDDKTYITTIRFGYTTSTLDIYSDKLDEVAMNLTTEAVDLALKKLQEQKSQIPPLTSAIKVAGRKLMEYQRRNIEVEVKARDVEIYSIKKIDGLKLVNGYWEISLELHVSKGFYVRSFARDLGELLGGYAVMAKLRRVSSSKFTLEQAIRLEDVTKETKLITIKEMFPYPEVVANERILKYILNGVTINEYNLHVDCKIKDTSKLSRFYFTYQGKLLSLYEKQGDIYRPLIKLGE